MFEQRSHVRVDMLKLVHVMGCGGPRGRGQRRMSKPFRQLLGLLRDMKVDMPSPDQQQSPFSSTYEIGTTLAATTTVKEQQTCII